jgi:phage replication-related protein YjqB (UPF0714/DUF867 family)
MWVWDGAVWVCLSCGDREGASTTLASADTHMGSLHFNNIGNEGARDLGAALQVNTTLTTLM